MTAPPFQVMPPLTPEEREALRADIASRGVLVPILVDQHHRVLDGHHRREIAAELGIECPTEIKMVDSDEQGREIALSLNLTRRHLNRAQRRELARAEIAARPEDSDRAIARRLGCSPSTVGSVRRAHDPSNLDGFEAVMERIITEVSKLDVPTVVAGEEDRWLDQQLQSSTLQLMKHRHDAAAEVGLAEYAEALGRHPSTIAAYVEGWKLWQDSESGPVDRDAAELGCSLVQAGEVRFAFGDAVRDVEDVFSLEYVAVRLRSSSAQLQEWRDAAERCPAAERTADICAGLCAAEYGDVEDVEDPPGEAGE